MLDLKQLKEDFIEFTALEKSFSKLDRSAKRLFLCASIYEDPVPVEALSWIMGTEKEECHSIRDPLTKLIQWDMISKNQGYNQIVYKEHRIVREFAQEKLEKEGIDKNILLARKNRYYENLESQPEFKSKAISSNSWSSWGY